MHFFYDALSRPQMVNFNGALYHYVHNLQGDIAAIVDNEGNKVVEYKYDAWGKPIGTPWTLTTAYGTLAMLNPFRYRGYVYDEETGLYYLRSRYYNPESARFTNADAILGVGNMLLTHNLFTYCSNRANNLKDVTGRTAVEYFTQQGQAISSVDGPYPFADIVWLVLLAGAAVYDYVNNKSTPSTSTSHSTGAGRASIQERIGDIAGDYGIGQCKEAAKAVSEYLSKAKKRGQIITITYPVYPGFIVSDTYGQEAISTNGVHVGVLFEGYVYCNVHPFGLLESEWLADFHGVPEWARVVTYIDF